MTININNIDAARKNGGISPEEAKKRLSEIDPSYMSSLEHFNKTRAKGADSDYLQTPIFYIFMTSPNLNLSEGNLENSLYIRNQLKTKIGKKIIKNLSFLTDKSARILIPVLTNNCEGFTPLDTTAQTVNVGETWTKLKQVYLGEDNDSRSGGSFNIEYVEKPGLYITNLHKIWYEYAQAVRRGEMTPSEEIRSKRAIDYQVSLYFFLCEPDGETLAFWSKYTGVMPTGIPYSSFTGEKGKGERIKLSIPYSFVYKEELDPEILIDFNRLADPSKWASETLYSRVVGTGSAIYDKTKRWTIDGYTWFKEIFDDKVGDIYKNTEFFPKQLSFNKEETSKELDEERFGSQSAQIAVRNYSNGISKPILFFDNDISTPLMNLDKK